MRFYILRTSSNNLAISFDIMKNFSKEIFFFLYSPTCTNILEAEIQSTKKKRNEKKKVDDVSSFKALEKNSALKLH